MTDVAAIVGDVRARGQDALREWALRLDGVEPVPAEPADDVPAAAVSPSRTPCVAGTSRSARPTSARADARASCSSGAGCRSPRSGSTSRAASSRRSSCAPSRPRSQASGGSSSRRRRRAPGPRSPLRRACSAWTRSGRSGARMRSPRWPTASPRCRAWTRSSGRVARSSTRPSWLVSRDVAIDLPGRPLRGRRPRSDGADRRIAELELAAQAEHGPGCRLPARRGRRQRRGGAGRGRGDRARAPRPPRRRGGGARAEGPERGGRLRRRRGRRSRRATTPPAETTCCRPAATRAPGAGSGWRRS